MIKKHEPFLIDLMDDTDSDSMLPRSLENVPEMGQYCRSSLMRQVFDDPVDLTGGGWIRMIIAFMMFELIHFFVQYTSVFE